VLDIRLKSNKKPDYKSLERIVFARIVLIASIALGAVFIILLLARGNVGDFIANLIQVIWRIPREMALSKYNYYVRNNLDYILIGTVALFFVILTRFLMSQFEKYFSEISNSLDALVEDNGRQIEMSSEMSAMESKLKAIKYALDEREREAQLAEQRKNDLVMYLAHDIKTPLTSVIGYLSLLEEAQDIPDRQKAKYIAITLDKAIRLEKLVDEFFEITRYSFQTIPMQKEAIDLYYMLAQMADEFYPLLVSKGQEAILDVPQDMVVYGDPDKLARVFNNILKNAAAYSPETSNIDIKAGISDATAVISFTNEGGIPKDQLSSIFDKFYRLDSSRSTTTGGAGLGLSIAKEIVALHGGNIYADSDGKQTTLTVELPCAP